MAAHRYWRLRVTANWGGSIVGTASLQLLESTGGNLATTGNGTASASSSQPSGFYNPPEAFDGGTDSAWFGGEGSVVGAWLAWDFGASPKDIVQAGLGNYTAASGVNSVTTHQIKDAVLEYSDDNSAWVSHIFISGNPQTMGTLTFYDYVEPVPGTAVLTAPIPVVTAYSGGTTALSAPPAICVGYSGGSSDIQAPKATLQAASGGLAILIPPSSNLSATAHDSTGEQAANLTAPSPTLSTYGGASSASTAPSPTLSATGTVTIMATATLSAPLPTLVAAATVTGTSNAALRAPIATLVGYSGAVCSVSVTGHPTLQATGTTGSIGGAQLTCPLFELTAGATAQNRGSANLIAPSPEMGRTAQAWLVAPGAQLTAIGSAVVTATYEAYATNLKHNPRPGVEPHDEVTHYTNFPFTHVVRYQNSYYGANSTGLYLLEGTTDDVTPIPWNWKTATTDFKSPQNKTVASAYFGGRLGPADTITLHAGEGAKVQAYSYTTPRGALAQNYRQAFGKGIKSHRYYALEASGTGELALDDISLDVHNLSRRI